MTVTFDPECESREMFGITNGYLVGGSGRNVQWFVTRIIDQEPLIRQRSVQPPEITNTSKESSPNIGLWHRVPALLHSLLDAFDASVRRVQEEIYDCDFESGIPGRTHHMPYGTASERGFKDNRSVSGKGRLKASLKLLSGGNGYEFWRAGRQLPSDCIGAKV
jgi:hypothetical protein